MLKRLFVERRRNFATATGRRSPPEPEPAPNELRASALLWRASTEEGSMAGKSIKNKRKYKALKRKGMSKSRAAAISNAGRRASRKGGKKGGRKGGRKKR
jgi:hypothetical protein